MFVLYIESVAFSHIKNALPPTQCYLYSLHSELGTARPEVCEPDKVQRNLNPAKAYPLSDNGFKIMSKT